MTTPSAKSDRTADKSVPTAVPDPEPQLTAEEILSESKPLKDDLERLGGKKVLSTLLKAEQEKSLKPFQAELILMQQYLEQTKRRMIILFEGP